LTSQVAGTVWADALVVQTIAATTAAQASLFFMRDLPFLESIRPSCGFGKRNLTL
jgi:hypothetical protein